MIDIFTNDFTIVTVFFILAIEVDWVYIYIRLSLPIYKITSPALQK